MSRSAPDIAALRDWIVVQGLEGVDLVSLLAGIGERLVTAGWPLLRTHMSFPTLDPIKRGENVVWMRGQGAVSQALDHNRFETAFQASPFPGMLSKGVTTRRWRLREPGDAEGYAAIVECFEAGATDYLVQLTAFGGHFGRMGALVGVAISVATDAPDGFTEAEITAWTELVPTVALAAYRIALSGVLGRVLGAYIGQDAGAHVLGGQIRHGEGHRVTAALMFADLRGFTAATAARGADMIPLLGQHLAAMAEPVEAAGGEVLKFLGDGLLAAFAVIGSRDDACASALASARNALARNAAVNAARTDGALDLDIALHLGEVFYGNIGAGSRLDFTVIGSAVNEASRLEGLCDGLGRSILMSEGFAAHCGQAVVSLGTHELRGVGPREIFGLADTSSSFLQG